MAGALASVPAGNDLASLLSLFMGNNPSGLLGSKKTGSTSGGTTAKDSTQAITDAITKAITEAITTSATTGSSNSRATTTGTSSTSQDLLQVNSADTTALQKTIADFSPTAVTARTQAGVDYQTDRILQGPLLNFINAQNQSGGYGGVNPYLSQLITDAAGQGAMLSNNAVLQGGQLTGNAAAAIAAATKSTKTTGGTTTVNNSVTDTVGTNTSNTTGTNNSTTSTNANTTANTNRDVNATTVGSSSDLTKTPLDLTTILTGAGLALAPSAISALGKALSGAGVSVAGVATDATGVLGEAANSADLAAMAGAGADADAAMNAADYVPNGEEFVANATDQGFGIGNAIDLAGAATGNPISIIKSLGNLDGTMDTAAGLIDSIFDWF